MLIAFGDGHRLAIASMDSEPPLEQPVRRGSFPIVWGDNLPAATLVTFHYRGEDAIHPHKRIRIPWYHTTIVEPERV